ncbi:hypothetical protein P4E94_11075 [Pontiellaceae bacterium B12219]|nr:hypothetical protein [Pontiellaceae bacterium B12219]
MKKLHTIIFILISMLSLQASVCAQQQTWTLADGTSFEGEVVKIFSKDVAFKNAKGTIKKIPLDRFSQESLTRIELEHPPTLSFNLIKDLEKVNFPSGIRDDTQRPAERRGYYGVRIKQTSAGAYNHELFLELYIIGSERYGDKLILLDRQEASFFLTEENNREFEFRSEHKVVLQNYLIFNDPRGEDYFGYLVVVKDSRGETIAYDTSHNFLFENIDNLRERYIWNFMDKNCVRVFPTRPPYYSN